MPRPKKCRNIGFFPENTMFTPENDFDSEVILTFEEIETLRLCDLKEMDQKTAAESMNISRGTLQRMVNTARKKVADAVIHGKRIRITRFECGENNCEYRLENNMCLKRCKMKHAFDMKGDGSMNNNNDCNSNEKNDNCSECGCQMTPKSMSEVEYSVSIAHEIEQIEDNIKYLEKRLKQAKKRLEELKEVKD